MNFHAVALLALQTFFPKVLFQSACSSRRALAKLFTSALQGLIPAVLLLGSGSLRAHDPDHLREDKGFAELARRHVFMVDYQGRQVDPVKEWKLYGHKGRPISTDEQLDQIERGIQEFFTANQTNKNARVAIFVHGGLNAYHASFDRLQNLYEPMTKDGCYPLLIVWNSGLWGTYGEHLALVRQGERRPVLGAITAPIVLATDLAKGAVRLPLTLSGRLFSDLQTTEWPDGPRVQAWEGFEELIQTNRPNTLHRPAREGETRGWGERWMMGGRYALSTPTKLVSLPLLDAAGTESLEMMLRRTRAMFAPPATYHITQRQLRRWSPNMPAPQAAQEVGAWLDRKDGRVEQGTGAMSIFGRRLTTWASTRPFDFYGHSLGTVVLNEMFRIHPDIQARHIVYMGAACSIHDMEDSLFPYLRATNHAGSEFFSISLHRVRERDEASFKDIPPRGSLLNWIDDIFAKPRTVTDRTLGTWENILRAMPDIPHDLTNRMHFRACDIRPRTDAGRQCDPQKHGDFDDFPFWQPQFYWPEPGTHPPSRLALKK